MPSFTADVSACLSSSTSSLLSSDKPGIPGPPEEQTATETHDVNGELIPIEDRKSSRPDGKIELREEDAWDDLGFSFPVSGTLRRRLGREFLGHSGFYARILRAWIFRS